MVGNAFSQAYFDFEKGRFLADYELTLASDFATLYHVPNTWENYEKLRRVLDQRLRAWRRSQGRKRWEFWKSP